MKSKLLLITGLTLSINLITNAQVCFNSAVNYTVGATQPFAICTEDFNNDGKKDIAVSTDNSNVIAIFLGTGTGTFGAVSSFTAGGTNPKIICSDFNNDGNIDLASANGLFANNVSIYLGNGAGSFSPPTNFGVGSYPSALCSADLNADGKMDIAVTNVSSNDISILLGNGTGSFATAVNFPCGGLNPNSVVTADFNSDSKLDLVVANDASGNISLLLGNGTGSFGVATTYTIGTNPVSVFSKDFNSDGKADVVTANNASGNVSVLLGTGTGSFNTPTNFAVINCQTVISEDFNGDGKLDLATAGGSASIMLGTGTGSFGVATTYTAGSGTNGICSADFNGDGKLDIATANYNSSNMSVLLNCNTVTTQTNCFSVPDGIDNTWSGGWSYKEYILPIGLKIDSVYMGATRVGYPTSQEDFIFSFCSGTTTYTNTTSTSPFNYQTDNNSEYNHWINLTSFNYAATGVVRVFLPVNAGAVWNNLCFALSSSTITGVVNLFENNTLKLYPNPANDKVSIEINTNENQNVTIEILDLMGRTIQKQVEPIAIGNNKLEINLSALSSGLYLIKCNNSIQKIQITK
jgi:hypothetical protein